MYELRSNKLGPIVACKFRFRVAQFQHQQKSISHSPLRREPRFSAVAFYFPVWLIRRPTSLTTWLRRLRNTTTPPQTETESTLCSSPVCRMTSRRERFTTSSGAATASSPASSNTPAEAIRYPTSFRPTTEKKKSNFSQ